MYEESKTKKEMDTSCRKEYENYGNQKMEVNSTTKKCMETIPEGRESPEKYVVLRWKDGWKHYIFSSHE